MLRDERGVSAVEFAIVLPVLALILFGIIDFAVLFYDKQVITNASREGARALIAADIDAMADKDADMKAFVRPIVQDYCRKTVGEEVKSLLINLNGSNDLIAANIVPSLSDPYVTVTVTFDYNHLFSLVTNFGQTTITGRTVMRME